MYLNSGGTFDTTFWAFLFRWLHVLSGIMWIGLLYYFNFVQIPNMPNIPTIKSRLLAKPLPRRALVVPLGRYGTVVTGLILGYINGYIHDTGARCDERFATENIAIGIGNVLGIIMQVQCLVRYLA